MYTSDLPVELVFSLVYNGHSLVLCALLYVHFE